MQQITAGMTCQFLNYADGYRHFIITVQCQRSSHKYIEIIYLLVENSNHSFVSNSYLNFFVNFYDIIKHFVHHVCLKVKYVSQDLLKNGLQYILFLVTCKREKLLQFSLLKKQYQNVTEKKQQKQHGKKDVTKIFFLKRTGVIK